jgi:hypothetical protein
MLLAAATTTNNLLIDSQQNISNPDLSTRSRRKRVSVLICFNNSPNPDLTIATTVVWMQVWCL